MPNRLIRRVWLAWEKTFHVVGRLQAIRPGTQDLFFIAKRRYLGRSFTVDGVAVRPFDTVIELHMNNDLLSEVLRTESQLMGIAVRLIHEARRSLPALAETLKDARYVRVKALYGVTFINRGIERFGFHTFPVQSQWTKSVTRWHLKNVFRMVNPDSAQLLKTHPEAFEPMLVAASKEHFVALHANRRPANSARPVSDHCLSSL